MELSKTQMESIHVPYSELRKMVETEYNKDKKPEDKIVVTGDIYWNPWSCKFHFGFIKANLSDNICITQG